jgi:hypothetical protein
MLFEVSFYGFLIVTLTVIIHAVGTTAWVRRLARHYRSPESISRTGPILMALTGTVVVAIVLHSLQIALWALLYIMLPDVELQTAEEAIYFSFVTFTTLGYGDITLGEGWRLLSGIEALNGIILLGWTTAMLFTVVQKIWQSNKVDD